MRWPVFVTFAVIALIFEMSIRHMLAIHSFGGIRPSFTAILVVYVALTGPREQVMWAAWTLGLLMDLVTDLPQGIDVAGPVIGPFALGYPAAAYVLLQIRSMLFRRSALSHAVVAVLFVSAANLVACFIYAAHGLYPDEQIAWVQQGLMSEAWRRFGSAVYTGLLALPLGRLLVISTPIWNFRVGAQRHVGWR